MPILKISKNAILQSQLLPDDYYKAKCIAIDLEESKDKKSKNFVYQFELEVDGRVMKVYVNINPADNSIWPMSIPMMEILEGRKFKDPQNMDIDTDNHVGKKCQVKIEQKPYEGRLVNNITEFLPYDREAVGAF